MATTVGRLEAILSANTRDFDQAIDHSHKHFSKAGEIIGKAALGIGAAVGVGLGITAKIGFDEFKQGQLVVAQTNAVLKSTGGIANVTAKHVDELGTSLMKVTGIDDEVIKGGENMLLTFKNIRNEVGKGNDIFDQSTKILLDMSTALGTEPRKAAIQLGKALNDPVKGITALTRVGVTFTQGQKDTIKSLVESGHAMDAQKIILRELQSEFGGSAEAAGKTFAGQMNVLKETFSNFAGEIIGRFAPALANAATVVLPLVLKTLDAVGKLIGDQVAPRIKQVSAVVENNWPRIQAIAQTVFGWIQKNVFPIVRSLRDIFVAAVAKIREVLDANGPELQRIFERLGAVITALAKVAIPILRFAFVEVLPRAISILIKALDLVSGALEGIVKGVRWIGEKGGPLLIGFKDAVMVPVNKLVAAFEKFAAAFAKIKDAFQWLIDNAKKIAGIFGSIGGAVGKAIPGGDIDFRDLAAPSLPNKSIDKRLWPAMGLGRAMGLNMVSGYRPGATVRGSGARSDHSYFPSKAVDEAGPAASMSRFAQAVTRLAGIDTVIYSPIGLWKAGVGWGPIQSAITKADHYSHVHVDTFDRGGWLKPGVTLAYNGTGSPERVGAGGDVIFNLPNYVGSKSELLSWLQNAAQEYRRHNGRSAF